MKKHAYASKQRGLHKEASFVAMLFAALAVTVLAGSGAIGAVAVGAINLMLVAVAEVFSADPALVVFALDAFPMPAFSLMIIQDKDFLAAGAGIRNTAVRVRALTARITAVTADCVIGVAETGQLTGPVFQSAARRLMAAVGTVAPAQTAHAAARMDIAPLAGVELAAAAIVRIAEVLRITLALSVLMLGFTVLADDLAVVPFAVAAVVSFNAAAMERVFGARFAQTAITVRAGLMRSFNITRVTLAHTAAAAAFMVERIKPFVTFIELAAGTLIVQSVACIMTILAAVALVMLKTHGVAIGVLSAAHETVIGYSAVVGTEIQAAFLTAGMLASTSLPHAGAAAFAYRVVKVSGYAHGLAAGSAVIAVLGIITFRAAQQNAAVRAFSVMLDIISAAVAFGFAVALIVIMAVAAIVTAVLDVVGVFRFHGFAAGRTVGADKDHNRIACNTVFFSSDFDMVDIARLFALCHDKVAIADCLGRSRGAVSGFANQIVLGIVCANGPQSFFTADGTQRERGGIGGVFFCGQRSGNGLSLICDDGKIFEEDIDGNRGSQRGAFLTKPGYGHIKIAGQIGVAPVQRALQAAAERLASVAAGGCCGCDGRAVFGAQVILPAGDRRAVADHEHKRIAVNHRSGYGQSVLLQDERAAHADLDRCFIHDTLVFVQCGNAQRQKVFCIKAPAFESAYGGSTGIICGCTVMRLAGGIKIACADLGNIILPVCRLAAV